MRPLALVILAAALGAAIGVGSSSRALSARCLDAGDRTTKLTLIEKLARNPGILILGSSRARGAEPSFLQRITGHTGFNAAVTGGTAADAWVMARFAADRWPHRARRYLWFVDSGIATNGVNPDLAADPRARRYLGASAGVGTVACRVSSRYHADGSIAQNGSRSRAERARIVARTVARLVASIRAHPPQAEKVDPRRYTYFERTIAFMNRHGSRPVIVLNPIHPRVLAELQKYGFPKRKAAYAYLDGLQQRLDFVVVDCEDIRAWGGSAAEFADATHVDRVNMRRMLRYIVAWSGGALG
jgi:hypothetical protein